MTVVQPNSIAGINSITVQSGNALNLHKSDGTLIRTLVAESGISTYSSIVVGSATTDNNANKSINIGLGASISQHADNTLSFGTNGDERARITSAGNIGVGNDASFPIYTDSGDRTLILGSGSDDAAIQLHSGTDKYGGLYFGDTTSGGDRYSGYVEYKHDDNFLRFGTGGTERVRIDSGGRLLLGATTSQEVYGTNPLQIQGTTAATSGMSLLRHGGSPYLVLGSSGGSSLNAVTALSSGNRIGQLTFAGADGTDINTHSASVAAYVDGSVSSNAVPGRLVFKTSTGASEVERMRITSSGLVGINTSAPTALLSFGVQRSVQTYPPICFQTAYGSGLADAAISTTDDSGGTDIMMGSNVYMGQNGTFTRYFSSYGSAAVRCGYTGITMFYNKSGNNAPAESMRIDGSGRLLIGTAANQHNGGDLLQLAAESSTASLSLNRYTANAHPSYVNFFKSRNASLSGQTVVQDGDTLGLLAFYGSDGTDRALGAEVCAQVDGTPGSDDMPGRLVFRTSADGSQSPNERLRISSNGNVLPGADATQDLGSISKRWANIYSADLQLSNEGSQNDVDGSWGTYTIQEGESDLFLINRRNGKKYKFNLTEVS